MNHIKGVTCFYSYFHVITNICLSFQLPLLYVLMSGKKKRDYKAVFRMVKDLLPSMSLQEIILDYEMAMWKAADSIFPAVTVRGCAFHWGQAVWRKVQDLGLHIWSERTPTPSARRSWPSHIFLLTSFQDCLTTSRKQQQQMV